MTDEEMAKPIGQSSLMSRRTIVPSEPMDRHHYVTSNPNQPFTYGHQPPTAPKKQIQYDTDAITQSRSFQILQGWISESEKTLPTSPSPASTTIDSSPFVLDGQHRRPSLSSLPSRSFRFLQDQYKDENPDSIPKISTVQKSMSIGQPSSLRRSTDPHTPSRAFRFLQQQLPVNRSLAVNNREDLQEIYARTPPSIREREPEAPRYSGSTIPSRSFRFLQKMTEDDQTNERETSNSLSSSTNFSNGSQFDHHPSRSFKYLQQMTNGSSNESHK